jgi:large subunit ribosomal protein L1
MSREMFLEAVKKVKSGKQRKFKQSIDMILNLKNIDLKKADNKIKTEFSLEHSANQEKIIGVFANMLIPKLKDVQGIKMIRSDEIDSYKGNKKKMKKLASVCYVFLAEAPLMPAIGKVFGPVLAPRGKMPKPIPPASDPKPFIENARNAIRVALKATPVVQVRVGAEDWEDEKIVDNIEKVVEKMRSELPRGKEQLKNVMIKTTMGKPEIVELNIKKQKK